MTPDRHGALARGRGGTAFLRCPGRTSETAIGHSGQTAGSALGEALQALREAAGMGLFGLGQGFEPVGDLGKALFASGFGHAGVHVGVFVCLTGDGRSKIGCRVAHGQVRGWVADRLQIVQVAMRVAGLAFRGVAEQARDIRTAFHVGLLGEIQVAAVGLRFAGKRRFQILVSLGAFQFGHSNASVVQNESRAGLIETGAPVPIRLSRNMPDRENTRPSLFLTAASASTQPEQPAYSGSTSLCARPSGFPPRRTSAPHRRSTLPADSISAYRDPPESAANDAAPARFPAGWVKRPSLPLVSAANSYPHTAANPNRPRSSARRESSGCIRE